MRAKIDFKIAEISDAPVLADLTREFYEYENLLYDEEKSEAALKMILSNEWFGRVWLIFYENEIAGYLVVTLGFSLEFFGRDAFVDEIYLREKFRRKGVGSQAVAEAEKFCREGNVRALHLEVERRNTKAQAFYRKIDFKDHDRYLLTKRIEIS